MCCVTVASYTTPWALITIESKFNQLIVGGLFTSYCAVVKKHSLRVNVTNIDVI